MTTRRRVAARQLEILLNFAETHRDVALGRFSGGPQAARTSRESWEAVALQLNSIEGGVTKTGDQWRRYWIELKAKTKCKAADSRRSAAATGGGPSKVLPLSEHEQRLLSIIGPVAVDGLPDVRLPVNIPTVDEDRADYLAAEIGVAGPSCPVPTSDDSLEPMEKEWLDSQSLRTTPTPSADLRPAQDESRPRQAPPSTGPRPVRRLSRQIPENAPQWAYDIESRRVAAEEQQAAAMQGQAAAIQGQAAAMQELAAAMRGNVSTMERLADAVAGLQQQMGRQAAATEALVEVVRAMNQN